MAVTTTGWSLVPVDGADGVDDVDVLLGPSLEGAGLGGPEVGPSSAVLDVPEPHAPSVSDAGQKERGLPRLGDRTSYGRHTPRLCWKCAWFAR